MRSVLSVIVLVALAALAALQVQAPFRALVVSGDSMEPGIHAGDLVIVRGRSAYAVGDVVSYQHRDLGAVIHRIVRIEGDAFILQGDNKAEPDAYPVDAPDVRGELLLRLPQLGGLSRASGPLGAVTLAAALTLVGSGVSFWRSGRRKGAGEGGARPGAGIFTRGEYFAITSRGGRAASILAALALTSTAALGATEVLGPTYVEVTDEAYEHRGLFSYEADGAPGVYDTPAARSGDPVFRRLADRMRVGFRYEFRSKLPATVRGTYRVDARISQGSGWNRNVALVPDTAFEGTTFETTAVLDLAAVQEMIRTLEERTGVESRSYLVTLLPKVQVDGTLDGRPIAERFTPDQRFLMDAHVLQPQPPTGTNDLNFERLTQGTVKVAEDRPRTFGTASVHLSIVQLRAGAIVVLALTAPALIGWLAGSWLARRGGESAAIDAEYDDILVRTHLDRLPPAAALVSVNSMDELVRIAELEHLPVLNERSEHAEEPNCYFVVGSAAAYYYRPHSDSQRPSVAA